MAFYIIQAVATGLYKMGYAADDRLAQRLKEHETSAGECIHIASVPGADPAFEKTIFRLFRKYRMSHSAGARRDYEIFRPAPQIAEWLAKSSLAKAEGFIVHRRPLKSTETCREWLGRCANNGCDEARFALNEERRLRQRVPATARGGWVLWEMISGVISRQLALEMEGIESHGVTVRDLNGWPMHRVTYRGAEYKFPVFAEACARQRIAPPDGAIVVGISPRSHAIPSGRKGKRVRGPGAPSSTPSNERQLTIGGV